MDLYYKDISPPCRAVYATIKYLDLPVTIKEIEVMSGETNSEEFKKLNPVHQIPLLNDDGFILGESRAIMSYLVNQYSPNNHIYPVDPETRATIDRILYFDATKLFPAMKAIYLSRVAHNKDPTEEQIQLLKDSIEELIALKGSNKFLAGNHATLADISVAMGFVVLKCIFPNDSKLLNQWYEDVEAAIPAVKELNDSVDWAPFIEMFKTNA